MFELLAGYHPLYDSSKDNEESFLKKLRNPQWNFPKDKFNAYFEFCNAFKTCLEFLFKTDSSGSNTKVYC
jgi:hypothetical protein